MRWVFPRDVAHRLHARFKLYGEKPDIDPRQRCACGIIGT